ncbi:hypothetical protein BGZ46_004256 [Entomortierella lignicola]|nr:hypothetical protein BGZ46_004256 [Entomortierella lignicola]
MFSDSSIFNNSSASSVANPAPATDSILNPLIDDSIIAENALFQTLFAMPAPINTINQDFCLFDADESSFDYPLFNGGNQKKSIASLAAAPQLNYFNNPLCTPQTPSLDLVSSTAVPSATGFDSCSAFLEDSAISAHLIDTPFTPYLDTPSLIDTPLETPYLADFGLDNDLLASVPLFSDFTMDFNYSIEPNMILPLDLNKASINSTVSSPVLSMASDSATSSVDSDDDDDQEFVSSRSAALVSGLKRKTATVSDSVSPVKKTRVIDPTAKKPAAAKRFSCSQPGCDRRFARLFNLHTHEKTHDPEQARPFTCPEADCQKSFSRKHDLQRHEASVHKGERNFACTSCHKPFSRQDGLRRHLAVKGPCSDNAWLAT